MTPNSSDSPQPTPSTNQISLPIQTELSDFSYKVQVDTTTSGKTFKNEIRAAVVIQKFFRKRRFILLIEKLSLFKTINNRSLKRSQKKSSFGVIIH